MDPFKYIDLFEQEIATYTGAPYAVVTDCCTHAIELAMRYDKVKSCSFSAYTYLSVLMVFHHLDISYTLTDDQWHNFYDFDQTRIRDSARCFQPNMYQPGTITCVSFGRGKPLSIGHGGALLLDDKQAYDTIRSQRYDGRDLSILPWQNQRVFKLGWHYKLSPDDCLIGLEKLKNQEFTPNQPAWDWYPDTRQITIVDE